MRSQRPDYDCNETLRPDYDSNETLTPDYDGNETSTTRLWRQWELYDQKMIAMRPQRPHYNGNETSIPRLWWQWDLSFQAMMAMRPQRPAMMVMRYHRLWYSSLLQWTDGYADQSKSLCTAFPTKLHARTCSLIRIFAARSMHSWHHVHVASVNSDETARMRRLIWVFAVRTCRNCCAPAQINYVSEEKPQSWSTLEVQEIHTWDDSTEQ